jgi:hypothetical protein
MARPKKRYHYIYKTTCNLNGKYYIGMHSTSKLEDGYMGSGKRLRYSIRKHGVENHIKEIIEFLEDRDSLIKREAEIVNENLLDDPLCMNLKCGGTGGFSNETHKSNWVKSGSNAGIKKLKELWLDDDWRKSQVEIKQKMWKSYDSNKKDQILKGLDWNGRNHTNETKKLISDKAKERIGSKNSQFGTCWITNEVENKKIKKGDLIPDGWRLGRKI